MFFLKFEVCWRLLSHLYLEWIPLEPIYRCILPVVDESIHIDQMSIKFAIHVQSICNVRHR